MTPAENRFYREPPQPAGEMERALRRVLRIAVKSAADGLEHGDAIPAWADEAYDLLAAPLQGAHEERERLLKLLNEFPWPHEHGRFVVTNAALDALADAILSTPSQPVGEDVRSNDLLSFVRDVCTDWDGSQIPDDGEPRVTIECAELRQMAQAIDRLNAEIAEERHEFKNFHRLLCERFDYCHDERDWKRDQVSLIEHIASDLAEERRLRAPVDDDVREELARAISVGRELNPDCVHQNYSDDEPKDVQIRTRHGNEWDLPADDPREWGSYAWRKNMPIVDAILPIIARLRAQDAERHKRTFDLAIHHQERATAAEARAEALARDLEEARHRLDAFQEAVMQNEDREHVSIIFKAANAGFASRTRSIVAKES